LQTGIFTHADVPAVNAVAGNVTVAQLERNDFIAAIAAVAPASLQRPTCRWHISPSFLPDLMKLKDGPGDTYLLKGPAQTEGEWELVNFPVTWTAQAPSVNTPGSKVAAFGESSCYLVALRDEFELMSSNRAKFAAAVRQLRAIARGRCDMRDATGFATLKLAAQ
jgi:HK97 family phage major capsid protein